MRSSRKSRARNPIKQRAVRIERGSENVFRDLGFDAPTAAYLRLRGQLAIALEKEIRNRHWTQKQAAAALKIAQPRVSELVNGQLEKFTIDTLVKYLAMLGVKVRAIVGTEAQ